MPDLVYSKRDNAGDNVLVSSSPYSHSLEMTVPALGPMLTWYMYTFKAEYPVLSWIKVLKHLVNCKSIKLFSSTGDLNLKRVLSASVTSPPFLPFSKSKGKGFP